MKAIIIAAGRGSRLGHLTENKPKCLLEFYGKTLLEHQLGALKLNGIYDISLIKGYLADKINFPNLRYYLNDNYQNNNILNSLFYAENEMNDDVIISYSDILYSPEVIKKLKEAKGDIVAVVDTNWQGYYEGRTDHPISEAENIILDSNDRVLEIGKHLLDERIDGEFIGMMKLSKKGCEIFKNYFGKVKSLFTGKPFMRAPVFEQAYITDMLQYLIDNNVDIYSAKINKGWMEIDTIQDYERAKQFILNGNYELD